MAEFDKYFLGNKEMAISYYEDSIKHAKEAIQNDFIEESKPFSGADPTDVINSIGSLECIPDQGKGMEKAMKDVTEKLFPDSIKFHSTSSVAHLHCPPIIPGIAAELIAASTNQGHASWDLGPSVDVFEANFIARFAEMYGLPDSADGVFTTGGTQANFTAMLIGRDWYADQVLDIDVQSDGITPKLSSLRIICSEETNFTIKQAAAYLGLGEDAVVSIPTDDRYRMRIDVLDQKLDELEAENKHPFFVVGTPGTTDFGSIDPPPEIDTTLPDGIISTGFMLMQPMVGR